MNTSIKTALRGIKKHKGYAFINTFGLALGLACCIMIVMWIRDERSFQIISRLGAETKEIDPAGIDWSLITAKNFDFRLRQDPCSLNALGQVKFMFPNRFNVYLHDTPSRELFGKSVRAF
jgi:hypothetical protein